MTDKPEQPAEPAPQRPGDPTQKDVLGLGGAWAMAVGGMIGGGIFSTLGVVISVAGEWAWLSFLIGGIIAFASGHSYSALTRQLDEPGGSYSFLRSVGQQRLARYVVWVLIVGYTLTVSVYAVTFGAYAANVFGRDGMAVTLAGSAAIVILTGVNLAGAAESSRLELVAVWGKLVILLGLALLGIWHWAPEKLELAHGHPVGWGEALVGTGVVFMAYEGFQLLSYDYDEMKDAKRTIKLAMPLAIGVTTAIYILVAVGAGMLAGANEIVKREEIALAIAGRDALGAFGFYAVSLAAVFSAASAINATVFATARLAEHAARDRELPEIFARRSSRDVPWAGITLIAAAAIVLVAVGGIERLVSGASLVFLLVFALVNAIAWIRRAGRRWISAVGFAGSLSAAVMLALYLAGAF
ncbi:MAG: APC family permease [Novosphingobium sp.]|nr:APC family permease [Novosphingobium sp.]MBO9603121.1 APC family permease [Novosphingobium sp.]